MRIHHTCILLLKHADTIINTFLPSIVYIKQKNKKIAGIIGITISSTEMFHSIHLY